MSKIRLIERDTDAPAKNDPDRKAYNYKWEVQAPAKLFGKRLRKKFRTKAEASGYKLELEIQLQNKRLAPLSEDIHLCVYRFQKVLTASQIEDALNRATVYYKQSDLDLQQMVDVYLKWLEKRHERGHVGSLHMKLHKGTAPRLVGWIGNIKLREITKKTCEAFIDERVDSGLAPRTIRNYADVLGAVLKQAVDRVLLSKNPMGCVEMPVSTPEVHILTPAE